jgi:hypothetical protein
LLNNDTKDLTEFIFAGGLMRRIKRSLKN